MAAAADAEHRVVLVLATRGEHGEVDDGFLAEGETLAEWREQEAHAAAGLLGVEEVVFLDYVDSGMMGTPENDLAGSFWGADVEEAAERLAAVLRRVDAGCSPSTTTLATTATLTTSRCTGWGSAPPSGLAPHGSTRPA